MRYLPLIGLYTTGGKKLQSGVSYSTQPSDIPYNAQAVEKNRIYEFVRMSGTCCAGMLVYYTGTDLHYVCLSGTGIKPAGVSLVSPTASGDWMWMQKWGINSMVHLSSTFDINQASALAWASLWAIGTSGCWKESNVISGAQSGGTTGVAHYVGQCLTAAAGSTAVGFINLL